MTSRYIVGDVFDVLATLKAGSVDLVFGSPPFLALRSYLPADHPDKTKEIGSEATPVEFLDTLLDVVEACDRVLAPHGSLCFELGDTYSGSGGAGGDYADHGLREGQPEWTPQRLRKASADAYPLAKSLCLIPSLFAASLAYGHNMLRPERTTPRWRIRNQIVWARSNPPVGALGDKYRPATSYVTVATKSAARYFDLDAVRTPHRVSPDEREPPTYADSTPSGNYNGTRRNPGQGAYYNAGNPVGAPPLDYWVIPTHPYPGAHYATFPPELVVKPVKSMCPIRVCRVCGEPSRRITDAEHIGARRIGAAAAAKPRGTDERVGPDAQRFTDSRPTTIGWTDCECPDRYPLAGENPGTYMERVIGRGETKWRPGCVLDPFAGSGTTLAVATGHGRDAIGIDLDERNAELALDRVGPMFLTVEHHG